MKDAAFRFKRYRSLWKSFDTSIIINFLWKHAKLFSKFSLAFISTPKISNQQNDKDGRRLLPRQDKNFPSARFNSIYEYHKND
uniref:Uncharacterized protein n=1 Tax=Rhizophora mucronata TaxID=61149 RepID=A0A2P2PQR3_RHIMU